MARGRRPQPLQMRIIRGNPGRRPLPQGEPQPPAGLPPAPDHLNATARAEWDRVGPILAQMGIMTLADRAVLAGYCATYARWAMAEHQIRGWTDLVVKGAMGGLVQNPHIRIANQALELMHRYMGELGLTPSSRVKLARGATPQDDELEAFLKQGKRPRAKSKNRVSLKDPGHAN
jgi:P27 family predicted phage terminase small subunit